MNSLKVKILGLVVLTIITAVAVATWHDMRTQRLMVEQMVLHNSRILANTIHNSIITSMHEGDKAAVLETLERVAKEPTIVASRIFDENGRILLSSDSSEIGYHVPSADLMSYRNHPESFALTTQNGETYVSTLPIRNTKSCHKCHSNQKAILGVFSVKLSLAPVIELQRQGKHAYILSSMSIIVILSICVIAFILYYVDSPIRKLVFAMTELEQGNFATANARISSSREMSLLAEKFNRMVERLQRLINVTVSSERKQAVHLEKLRHQDAIDSMHLTLEDRLVEIEQLNMTLEERVNEVEEANYKISDLAANLEDRNTTLANTVNRLSSLYEMGLAVNSTMDQKQLFKLLLKKALESLNSEVGYILLSTKERNCLQIGEVVGIPEGEYDPNSDIPLEPGGVSYWVIEHRKPLLISKIDEAIDFDKRSKLGFSRDSVICAPLHIQDEIIGTITIANRKDGSRFYEEDLEMLSTIAAQASVAIKNALLYGEQQDTYLSTVQALVSAIEASDPYTRGHSERVTRYSVALATDLCLPKNRVKDLEQAAILHDIGKIGIDVSLLNKVGPLSPVEISRLREHPQIGKHILAPIRFMSRVREIISQHHEHFDGSGYPAGLKGDQLLVESRILSITDSFDAMTSDRPYRKAIPTEVAINEIRQKAGSQFDPEIAAIFVDLAVNGMLDSEPTPIHWGIGSSSLRLDRNHRRQSASG